MLVRVLGAVCEGGNPILIAMYPPNKYVHVAESTPIITGGYDIFCSATLDTRHQTPDTRQ